MLDRFEKFVAKKIFRKLIGEGIKQLPFLLKEADEIFSEMKKDIVFTDDELPTVFPSFNYDLKKFMVFIMTKKGTISRVHKTVDLTPYMNDINKIDVEKLGEIALEKVNLLLTDGEEK